MPGSLSIAAALSEGLLLAVAALWVLGAIRLSRDGRSIGGKRAVAFGAGMMAAATISSPWMDDLGAQFFSLHMLQHLLLILVAAPLIVWSRPSIAIAQIAPLPQLRWRGLEPAWASAAIFSTALLVWHVPAAHDWAVAYPAGRLIEHLSMLIAALAFWHFVVLAGHSVAQGVTILIVWLISLQGALISAVIMFAPVQLCGSYADNPLTDQVLAGLLMCIPASLAYAGSSVWALARLFEHRPNHGR